jgi:hypothetical protein
MGQFQGFSQFDQQSQKAAGNKQGFYDFLNLKGPEFEDLFRPNTSKFQNPNKGGRNILGYTDIGTGRQLTTSGARGVFENMQPNAIDQLAAALFREVPMQQAAADRQFARNQQQIDEYGNVIDRNAQALRDLGVEQNEMFQGQAGDLRQRGQAGLEQFEKGAAAVTADVRGEVDRANRLAAGATASYEQTIAETQDRVAQDAMVVATSLRKNAQSAIKMAEAGLRPDGTKMTGAERFAAMTQIRNDTEFQVSGEITRLMSRFNEMRANMGGMLASLKQQQAGTALGGAGTIGQVGTALSGQRVQALGLDAQMQQFASQVSMFGEQLRSAGLLEAANYEAQGRAAMAEMVANNPESIISLYAGLASLFSLASAPGVFDIEAFNIEGVT